MSEKKNKRTLKVIYSGELDYMLDDEIREVIESLGFKWYAQGYNFEDDVRDIAFSER